jgi:outer membrane protein assembly factor BamB
MRSRRVLGGCAFPGLIVIVVVAIGCGAAPGSTPSAVPAAPTSQSLETATSSTRIADAFTTVFALAYDESAIYAKLIRGPRSEHDNLARFDRTTGTTVIADAVTQPLAAIRAGKWLFVVAGGLLRLDPSTLHVEQRLTVDGVSTSLTIVGDELWVPTAHGVLRVSIATGATLAGPVGEFDEAETIVDLATAERTNRVYAVVAQSEQRYSLATLDPRSGHVIARGPTIGAGPGGANISNGDHGLWFSISTGMLGYSVRVDPATLTRLDVRLDTQARPTAIEGIGVLWVDESWGGTIACADAATGAILWRKDVRDNAVSFARDSTGLMTPFQGWVPVDAPALCAQS